VSHRYCGRDFHPSQIAEIRRLIAEDPDRTRAELSRLTCRMLAISAGATTSAREIYN